MEPRTAKKLTVVTVIAALALGGILSQAIPISKSQVAPKAGNQAIVFVGTPSGLAGETLALLESRFQGPTIQVSELTMLSQAARNVDASSIVVFNSEWLAEKVQDAILAAFLRTVLPTQAKVAAIGGSTSLLFDALKQVNEEMFAEGRNPAADNPPLVGYRLKQSTSPNGALYYGESILIGYPANAVSAASSIVSWG